MFGCELLFNIQKKILVSFDMFAPLFKYQIVIIVPREGIFFEVGVGGREKEKESRALQEEGGKKERKKKKPSGNLKNIFISPFNSPPF